MSCDHRFKWFTTLHGDTIIWNNYQRTLWECIYCNLLESTARYIKEPDSTLYSLRGLQRLDKEK